ncbi:MAG: class I SAM-dependent methyltransferase [Verrucomicrobiia bacterium]
MKRENHGRICIPCIAFQESRTAMNRLVQPELLDTLPFEDPRAIHSRRDLRRINAWMRNHTIMAAALQTAVNGRVPGHITDLGAGDGHFLVRVAKKISPRWPGLSATLLDNQKATSLQTLTSFTPLGWRAEAVTADVFDWLPAAAGLDVVVANLFLHHFNDPRLAELFRAIAGGARLFIAIEPRRAPRPLFCSRLLWAIGCNSVTRHDAAVSVRAGFSGNELSALWPVDGRWQLTEHGTGLFSHLFVARRTD